MIPDQIKPMMAELGDLPNDLVDKLKSTPEACLLGDDRLAALNLRWAIPSGSTASITRDVDLDFKIVGRLPGARYATGGDHELQVLQQRARQVLPDVSAPIIRCTTNASTSSGCAWRDKDTFKKSARSSKTTGS